MMPKWTLAFCALVLRAYSFRQMCPFLNLEDTRGYDGLYAIRNLRLNDIGLDFYIRMSKKFVILYNIESTQVGLTTLGDTCVRPAQ